MTTAGPRTNLPFGAPVRISRNRQRQRAPCNERSGDTISGVGTLIRMKERDCAMGPHSTEDEELGAEASDAFCAEIDGADDEAIHEVGRVVVRDLCARSKCSEVAEVDGEFQRGLTSVGEGLDVYDAADA
jgi:hypothetical protein